MLPLGQIRRFKNLLVSGREVFIYLKEYECYQVVLHAVCLHNTGPYREQVKFLQNTTPFLK
jgi:hypothetical protein